MNYQNRALIDELASQYAIGTLRGAARLRFERLCRHDTDALLSVQRWEDRLIDLASAITPVRPPATVWRGIQQRLDNRRATQEHSRLWHRQRWALAAGVAMMVFAVTLWTVLSSSTHVIATIVDAQQAQLWRIEAPSDRDALHIEALDALQADASHAYELWALSAAGGPPISLGLMPQSGNVELQLTQAQRIALAGARQIAISLEPSGGSPSGAPTGPVLYVAAIAPG